MQQVKTKWNPELYNDKHAFVFDYGEDLLSLLHPEKNERILDLGCGAGQLTFKISELAKEVVGIDQSEEMIANAQSNYDHIQFLVADGADFSFEEKFDAIFSNAALHWIINYKGAIQCMHDNLKPGGRIVLELGGKGNVQTIVNQLRVSLAKRNYSEQAELQLWYFPSIGEYATELEAVGFRVTMAQHFDRPTKLADEKAGIRDWISMFGESFFKGVLPEHIEQIKDEVQENVKSQCFYNGAWHADYKRIRIIALKE
jgi:trans-aconitate methyltransferase